MAAVLTVLLTVVEKFRDPVVEFIDRTIEAGWLLVDDIDERNARDA